MKPIPILLACSLLLNGCDNTDTQDQVERNQAFFRQHPLPPLQLVSGSGSFILPLLPDTQFYAENNHRERHLFRSEQRYPDLPYPPALAFYAQTYWLAKYAEALQVPLVVHLGDVVENAGAASQWQTASGAMRTLEERGVPYSIATGERDVHEETSNDDQRSFLDRFKSHFGPERAAWQSTYVGSDPKGLSQVHLFQRYGQSFLLLALDWSPSEATLDWAQGVLDTHPHVPVILASHSILRLNAKGVVELSHDGSASGPRLWDRLIRHNDQVFLTLSAHVDGAAHTRMFNDLGHSVDMVMVDYQHQYLGGNGLMQLLELDLRRSRLGALSLSPWVLWKRQVYAQAYHPCATPQALHDCDQLMPAVSPGWDNRFLVDLDYRARFASFQGYTAQLPVQGGQTSLLEQLQAQLGAH
ncbi:calcineurin [Pseudomonas sp. PDNC002]|uniref:calcineurin n=1 Tax=Pseudomonas sp. PDNC002 TaxID=2811422 RepID=UPI0019640F53|nr:calcineurin [Pseudomonas sp. PDNC002]QRY79908.1 calcineurin [Pseudomonas sp. PDNC002]